MTETRSLRFEVKILALVVGGVFLSSLVAGGAFLVFFGRPFSTSFTDTLHTLKHLKEFLFPIVTFALLVFLLVSSLLIFLVSIFSLHRIAGPTVRIERVIEGMERGDFQESVSLRKGDELRGFARTLEEVNRKAHRDRLKLREAGERLMREMDLLRESPGDEESREKLMGILRELEEAAGAER
ncbi:MAG: hypothetical protein D6713_07595 [Deltaproteobacteria bacterium]|nr:MAG: hypothetical protein D6713_07595 [Deltaproteobacteria bacterium]